MNPERKDKLPTAKATLNDRHEIGVCGTGKHRVININPLLLTPASASKIYSGRKKHNNYGANVSGKSFGVISPQPRVRTALYEDTPGSDIDSLTPLYSNSASDLWRSPSRDESERSLSSSMVTLDDVNDISESEVTDVSDLGSIASLSHTAQTFEPNIKSGPSFYNDNLLKDTREEFSNPLNKSPKNKATDNRHGEHPLKRNNIPKRERIIEISPSLMLPVTSVPSHNQSSGQKTTIDKQNINKQEFHSRNTSTLSTSSSRTSLSDMQSFRQSNTDENDVISSISDQVITTLDNNSSLLAECERLQQALKLADADIAILVSSKQQLQLEFHNEEEKVKTLSQNLYDAMQKNESYLSNIEELKNDMKKNQENNDSEMRKTFEDYKKLELELKSCQNSLDVANADKDSKNLNISVLNENLEKYKAKLERAEQELQDVTSKNISIESLLQEVSTKGEGTEEYVKHLNEENSRLGKRVYEVEQENMMLKVENKTHETKMADFQQLNQELAEKASKHESRFRKIDAENATLTTRLNSATKEKSELNSAVSRLRGDLTKVESSFSRLKQQMLEKSKLAEDQTSKRQELEEKVKSLIIQNEKLNNVNADIRIKDKNIQIEQLLTKSRVSTAEKTRLEKKIEKLQAHIDANQKSWVQAIEKEKQKAKLVREKDDLISMKMQENNKLSEMLNTEKQKYEQLSSSLDDSEKLVLKANKKFTEAEETIDKLQKEKVAISALVEEYKQRLLAQEQNNQRKEDQYKEERIRLKGKINYLDNQIDSLQKAVVSKEEEIKSIHNETLQKSSDDNTEQESHSLHQLQLLSELQSARRELSHDKEQLIQENNNVKSQNSIAEAKIVELEKLLENEKVNSRQAGEDLRLKTKEDKVILENEIAGLQKKLKEDDIMKHNLEEEMSIIKDHNNVLSQQLGTLQIHNGEITEQLKKKIQEFEDITTQYKTAKEEMEILKQELSGVTLQLSNTIYNNEKSNEAIVEKETLLKEMEVLRNTVMRQQQYAVSLQKHYEKWAQDAAEKMRIEISRIRSSAKDEAERSKNEISNLQLSNPTTSLINSSTQTDHDLLQIPLQPDDQQEVIAEMTKEQEQLKNSLIKEQQHVTILQKQVDNLSGDVNNKHIFVTNLQDKLEKLSNENIQLMNTIQMSNQKQQEMDSAKQTSVSDSTQTDHNKDVCVTCENCAIKQSNEANKYDSSTQTDHNEERIGNFQDSSFTESSEASMLEEEKLRLMEENTQQAETIAVLQERLNNWSSLDSSVLEDVGTQTTHDDEVISHSQHLSSLLEDSSTQTDHDSEPVGHNINYEIENRLSDMKIFYDQKCETLENEKVMLQGTISQLQISFSEQRTRHLSTSSSTQTDHDNEPMSTMADSHDVTHSSASATQTDHNDEIVHPVNKIIESRLQESEKLNKNLVFELETARKKIEELQEKHETISFSTQTDHDFETILSPTSAILCENSSTQTDHDNDILLPDGGIVQNRLQELEQINRSLMGELVLAKSAIEDLKSSHDKLLEDTGTQTNHDNERLSSSSSPDETNISLLLEDSSTQTNHNDDQVPSSNMKNVLEDELATSRQERDDLVRKLNQKLEENEQLLKRIAELQEILIKNETLSEGTQTSHDIEAIQQQSTVKNVMPTNDAFSQTEHEEEPVRSSLNQAHPVLISGTSAKDSSVIEHVDGEISNISENLCSNPEESSVCHVCGGIRNVQYDLAAKPPSPMTILQTMESRKFRAYKKTVSILKKKLQSAENTINDLQAELKMLRPALLVDSGQGRRSVDKVDENIDKEDSQEETKELAQLKNEIYKVKKSAALQAEDARRKSLAERKILESKVANLNERLQGLTDINEQLRNSVESLQVKLTDKARLSDIAMKEKNRYQLRSRRLQASLRSLSWITGSNDKSLFSENGSDLSGISFDGSFNDSTNSNTFLTVDPNTPGGDGDAAAKSRRSSTGPSVGNLPASVVEIEESLKDLQSEIIALEKQMQEHNTAVRKSKNQWTRLKQESNNVAAVSRNQTSLTNKTQHIDNKNSFSNTNTHDHITQISKIV